MTGVFGFWQHDGTWRTPAPGERIPVYLVSDDTVTLDPDKAHPLHPKPIGIVAIVDNPESWRGYVQIETPLVAPGHLDRIDMTIGFAPKKETP